MLQNSNTIQPKVVTIRRRPNQGFGFTLRHFIAYPPEDDPAWPMQEASDPTYQVKAMETIFIKEVQPNGPAHYANLQTGDRVLMVNNTPIAGITYLSIVSMIKQTPAVLTLHVVPKECDLLQMHYTSIAHTPESNRLNTTAAVANNGVVPKPIPPPPLNVVGNGNAAGALIPIAAKTFPQQQQQLISFSAPAVPPSLGQGSRSGSITSTTSSSLRPLIGVSGGGGSSLDFDDMSLHHGTLLMRGDGAFMRSPPPNLTVLSRQQHQQHQQHQQYQQQQQQVHNCNFYPPTAVDTSDLMIRLRESIKQKEEFLKSPLPHAQLQQQHAHPQQHFFPHTPPSGSPQLSMVSTSSTSVGSSGLSSTPTGARGHQARAYVKQPLSATSSASSTRELLPAGCDMQNYYVKNTPGHFGDGGGAAMSKSTSLGPAAVRSQQHLLQQQQSNSRQQTMTSSNGAGGSSSSGVNTLRDKYPKDYDYLETLQETGVTNKVFERKLVSHMSKGFDPFKPLSINTNNVIIHESSSAPGNVVMLKKPGVLYESLQHHPLHQLQVQQLQQLQQPKLHHATVVDGQQCSRMEIHKATLATTIDHAPLISKYSSKLPEAIEEKSTTPAAVTATTLTAAAATTPPAALSDIAEHSDMPSGKAAADGGVVRRYKPLSSFDEGKPMRRISYLRATNNENDYQSDSSSITTKATSSAAATIALTKADAHPPEHTEDLEPTYDVVAGGADSETAEALTGSEDDKLPTPTTTVSVTAALPADSLSSASAERRGSSNSGSNSRRASATSDIRNSVHLENINAAELLNGKSETKDVATEMEIFETEMEIKSSCINGKRLSEYRSWRQVKIEIKGDILKIYPSRNSKSDVNVIELDIRNFKIFEESVDKKKYIFRMQSKPTITHLVCLSAELNLDDDKLTSSGNSAAAMEHAQQLHQQQQQQNTEILFKTKSINEMRRIFGLLQWKSSLIFDDSDLQGKQLAEPQKTVASASMPTATYCDDNVQQQHPEYSPLSTTSRGGGGGGGGDLEASASASASDSISPVMKTRKSASHKNIPDKDLGSPKAINWKHLFRRGGGGSSASSAADVSPWNLTSAAKTCGSISVPLKTCPMSANNEYLPQLVEVCTNIVETKGLSVVGIYRIPGNKAAISELCDQVNKPDFSWERCNTDVRWEDVNVVSSLLKLFIRSLPDALLPSSFYNHFIEADKKSGLLRLQELKELLESLPRYSYETMKHLIRHLNRVSKNCSVNLMEPKNLAIIFGPSIIRTPNDTLEIAVKDMKHQCRIVELLVTQYDYFFERGNTPDIADVSGNLPASSASDAVSDEAQSQQKQTNMLLHNVSKIERLAERETTTRTSRFIPQLRRRGHGKRSSDTYSGESVLSLDYTKVTHAASSSSTNVTTASSSSSSSTNTSANTTTTKKKERGFLAHHSRSHHRKASLDEKDSGSGSGGSLSKEQQRSSVDISILLTDDESSNSHISDTGSMSLTTITDTLDTKLHNLRNGSISNDEHGSPDFPKSRRHTLGQPLQLPAENIPYADESPERHFYNACPLDAPNALMLSRSCTSTNTLGIRSNTGSAGGEYEKQKQLRPPVTLAAYKSNKLQHSATAPISSAGAACATGIATPPSTATTPTAVLTVKTTTIAATAGSNTSSAARNSYSGKNLRFSSSVYDQGGSEDDSEGSTTSDPKEALVIASPSFFLDRYNKKRRDHRLFRSASFNCRNYSTRHGGSGSGACAAVSALTKDEKTDMNLTKKRQIQNKQNRSIKRRHTVGGPHDYAAAAPPGVGAAAASNCNHHCGKTATSSGSSSSVLRRIPIPSANANISNNNSSSSHTSNNNSAQQPCDGSNGNNGSSNNGGGGGNGAAGTATTVAVAGAGGEHVLEVGIRIKNINRSRY